MVSMSSSVSRTILVLHLILMIFFFQAEDGIRDTSVTGVQTCALPIYLPVTPVKRPVQVPVQG